MKQLVLYYEPNSRTSTDELATVLKEGYKVVSVTAGYVFMDGHYVGANPTTHGNFLIVLEKPL